MAQVNITLEYQEFIGLLSKDRDTAFGYLLEKILNEFMQAESKEQLGADRHERTNERQDYRNGVRERQLTTRIGTITLRVPRHRDVPFTTMIFDNYQRSEAALISAMVEMVVSGVSTRKVSNVVEELCGKSFSKSTVSELCGQLDETVDEFRNRPLENDYPFIITDATYFKVRENHRIVSKAFMIAMGITGDGRKEIIGFDVYDNESKETWEQFFSSLEKRGLKDIDLITSDAHGGLIAALKSVFPQVPWQRCQYHFTKNIVEVAPKKEQEGLRTELREMFSAETLEKAREKRDEIINDYKDVAERSVSILDEGFEDAMTVMQLPIEFRKPLRTSNYMERENAELKKRSKVIKIFPNTKSLSRIMGAVLMERHDTMSTRRPLFSRIKYAISIQKAKPKLTAIAEEQIKLLQAA